jgi:hypothetical protein
VRRRQIIVSVILTVAVGCSDDNTIGKKDRGTPVDSALPRDISTPARDNATPARDTSTPARDSATVRDTSTPARDSETPARDSATPRDSTSSDTGFGSESCGVILRCANNCQSGDTACESGCIARGDQAARQLLQSVFACLSKAASAGNPCETACVAPQSPTCSNCTTRECTQWLLACSFDS